jgi:hypothetical protein
MLDPIYRAAGTVTQRHVWFLTPPADLSVRMTRAIAEGQGPSVASGFDVAGLHPTGGRFDLICVPVT